MNQNDIPTPPAIPETLPDLQTKVSSSVSGFVTDQNDAPVVGAEVKAGSSTVSTDRYGYFELKNIQVVKEAATVTVNYPGYFKAIKTYMATEGKAAFFRIKLLQKTIIGTIDATSGGNVSINNGMNISFPANAIKNTNGNNYNGEVNIAAQYLDPTSAELNNIMPGDLRAINADGYMRGLTSFGMIGVELTGSGGESLQIADGKKSTITMPVPASITAAAPATIPLWHFDESNGLWKEEGSATKQGNNYVGEVGHFSYWNCDLPNATVPLTFTIVDSLGRPVPYLHVEIIPVSSNSWSHVGGWTDETGYVAVPLTANTQYELSIFSNNNNNFYFVKSFTAGTTAIDFGNIVMDLGNIAYIHGTVTDCNNNLLPGARVLINTGHHNSIQYTDQDGKFGFTSILWNNSANLVIIAENINASQQSNPRSFTVTSGNNTTANIQACGVSTDMYLDCRINGRTFVWAGSPSWGNQYFGNGPDSVLTNIYWTSMETQNGVIIPNSISNLYFFFWSFGDPQNSSTENFVYWIRPFNNVLNNSMGAYPLSYFSNNYKEIPMHLTEYGPDGGFIAGSFSGRFYETINALPDLATPYDITCNFRIRRQQ